MFANLAGYENVKYGKSVTPITSPHMWGAKACHEIAMGCTDQFSI